VTDARPNTPVPDELNAVRLEIKRLAERESELKRLLITDPELREGKDWLAEIRVTHEARTDAGVSSRPRGRIYFSSGEDVRRSGRPKFRWRANPGQTVSQRCRAKLKAARDRFDPSVCAECITNAGAVLAIFCLELRRMAPDQRSSLEPSSIVGLTASCGPTAKTQVMAQFNWTVIVNVPIVSFAKPYMVHHHSRMLMQHMLVEYARAATPPTCGGIRAKATWQIA